MFDTVQKHRNLPDLPEDVFLLILDNLEAWHLYKCRRVCRAWKDTFENEEYLAISLKKFSSAREAQSINQQALETLSCQPQTRQPSIRKIFDTIASRYYHLIHGKARAVEKYKLCASEQFGSWLPITQWEYHESQPGGRLYYEDATHISTVAGNLKPFLFRPTLWSYDDGLVVFAPGASCTQGSVKSGKRKVDNADSALVLLDLHHSSIHPIPFDTGGKTIRNLRLRHRTLIIEWAEKQPFYILIDSERVHPHYATCFDVFADRTIPDHRFSAPWVVKYRNEFKIHCSFELALTSRDRFFSTHNAVHYAVYFWQPNRSVHGGDEGPPVESLSVWDISIPSPYRPSCDPVGEYMGVASDLGPQVIRRLVLEQLDHYGTRQNLDVALMSLHLDSGAHTLTMRENVCVAGQGYYDPAERLSCAKTTAILFEGQGPYFYREWDGNLPPYRGHCSMESADVETSENWFLPIMDVLDEFSGVRFSLVQTCFTGKYTQNSMMIRVKVNGLITNMEESLVEEVANMGKIAGDERWLVGQNDSLELVVLKF